MTIRVLSGVVLVAVVQAILLAQQSTPSSTGPTFEVASVKRAAPPAGGLMTVRPGSPLPGGGWLAANATLREIITSVYREFASPDRIIGGPDWITRERFEINAKAEGNPPPEQINLMVRQLLGERFKLKVHTEQRQSDVYALVVARPDGRLGERLKRQAVDCAAVRAARNRTDVTRPSEADLAHCQQRSESLPNGMVRIRAGGFPIDGGLTVLLGRLDRPVVDRTGLTGGFDFEIEYVPQRALQAAGGDVPSGPSIFTALQEQLGLKLEPRRESLEVLVIDSVEMPTPD